MKKSLLFTSLLLLNFSIVFSANWNDAQWLWQPVSGPANTWMAFRKTFNLNQVPTQATANIAVDSKYWLWVNGNMVLFEGGLARGAAPNTNYYDVVDLSSYLVQGKNTIAVLVWYWGRTRKTHEDSGKGGLIFQADLNEIVLKSDNSWKMKVHPAYDPLSGGGGTNANRVNPYSIKFDARTSLGDWTEQAWYSPNYDDSSWSIPTQKGQANSSPWGQLVERSVPQWNDRGLSDYESLSLNSANIQLPYTNITGSNVIIKAKLPFNKQITPYLQVNSTAGKTVFVTTDDPQNLIDATYITKSGIQQFESYSWFNGHNVEYTIAPGVEVLELKYRWTGVGEMVGTFESSDNFYNRLWWMARNTLYICARDNYMDCPDRERGLWIGDVADQAGAVFYTLDEPGRKLLKKAIDNTIAYRDGDTIQGLAPGFGDYRGTSSELTSQSLQFIDQGIWQYYYNTGDISTLANAYPAVLNYLKLWNMLPNGLPEYRKGYANWVDWGDNTDTQATNVCWYYIALKAAKEMALTLDKIQDVAWYDTRINSIKAKFIAEYWRGTHYGTRGRVAEERVTALAVLSGLADVNHYTILVENNLFPVRMASPHMEWMVEEALILTGNTEKALTRMKERYQPQVSRTNLTTLYETFENNGGGTPNHAWNAPNYVLSRYIAGIKATELAWKTFEVCPNLAHLSSLKTLVPTVKGNISLEVTKNNTNFSLILNSPAATTAIVGIPKTNLNIDEVQVNGQIVWKDNAFVAGVQGITFDSEDDAFLKFKTEPGNWIFNAKITVDNAPTISFVTPAENTVLEKGYSNLSIQINATDDNGIAKVELFIDDQLIANKTEAPFNWSASTTSQLLGLSVGKHVLKAIATDKSGKTAEATVNVSIIELSSSFANKLVFYYPLEDNGLDLSANKNNATIGNAISFANGKTGKGAVFSFTQGSYLSSADSVFKYSYPTAYTIAFWMKVHEYSDRKDIIQAIGGRTLLYSNGDLSFRSYHQKQVTSFNVTDAEKDGWIHVAMVMDQRVGQTQQKYYINGEQRGNIASGYALDPDKPMAVGKLIFGSTSETSLQRNFIGMLDEIYMFDDILSAEEISFIMNTENLMNHLPESTGIDNVYNSTKLKLYPLPANQILHIEGVDAVSAGIYTISGQLLNAYTINANQLDVSSLQSGMYILKIMDSNGFVSTARFNIH